MAEGKTTNVDINHLAGVIDDTANRLGHAKVNCEGRKGEFTALKDDKQLKILLDKLTDLQTAAKDFELAIRRQKDNLRSDRDSGISMGERISGISLRDSLPIQESGEGPIASNNIPLEHEDVVEAVPTTACMISGSFRRGPRSTPRQIISSQVIPEEK